MEPLLKQAVLARLEAMRSRLAEIDGELARPGAAREGAGLKSLVRERGRLAKFVDPYLEYRSLIEQAEEWSVMAAEAADPDEREGARREASGLRSRAAAKAEELRDLLIFEDEDAGRDVILEIRAGTGGEEAALFAADLLRMYTQFADRMGWKVEVMSSSPTALGGYREVIFSVRGEGAGELLRYESGGHRVQRIPATESSGRIHTSACTVAVLPEVEDVELSIEPEDLHFDTMRAGGPGGQHVNKTSSAVRVTHVPTGLVVRCQDEKSQHKNRVKAMRILRSRLYDQARREKELERADRRRTLIGSGDRSQRIRTYNFPQNRVTDHRVSGERFGLEQVLRGELEGLGRRLRERDREERLNAI